MDTITLNFVSFLGDILMTIDVVKGIKWSSVLVMIATEAWYLTCYKWRFVLGSKDLEPDDVFNSDEKSITITCVKIFVPQIIFMLPSGEVWITVPFESCKQCDKGKIYVIEACFEAHKKLRDEGKDGYGTDKAKVHSLIASDTSCGIEIPCRHRGDQPYVFRDNSGKKLNLYDVLEDPGNDNLVIVVVLKNIVYCSDCSESRLKSILRIKDQYTMSNGIKNICPNCGFLHCLVCDDCIEDF
jgi:hypothetical protein